MIIRLATEEDLDELRRVYDTARAYMRAQGNTAQWTNGHPTRDLLLADIAADQLYVIEENGKVHAGFVLMHTPEPVYDTLVDGAWIDDGPYATIHRIASDGQIHGVVKTAVQLGLSQAPSVRIDTHESNESMKHVVAKLGFKRCGIVTYPDAGDRIAYQLIRE